jgi:hypothetical protein
MEQELINKAVARQSVLIYLPISIGAALLFLLAATLGDYPLVARIGGAIWVAILSLIVAMPIVITHAKRRVRNVASE